LVRRESPAIFKTITYLSTSEEVQIIIEDQKSSLLSHPVRIVIAKVTPFEIPETDVNHLRPRRKSAAKERLRCLAATFSGPFASTSFEKTPRFLAYFGEHEREILYSPD